MTTLSKYNNNKQNMVRFYKKWKNYNEIQLTKNKMDLNIQKMTNHPPSPETLSLMHIQISTSNFRRHYQPHAGP